MDFSAVEQVIQVGSPKGIARLMQRAGRSGHRPGQVSLALCALFMFVVVSVLVYSVKSVLAARAAAKPSVHETPFQALPAAAAGVGGD